MVRRNQTTALTLKAVKEKRLVTRYSGGKKDVTGRRGKEGTQLTDVNVQKVTSTQHVKEKNALPGDIQLGMEFFFFLI